MERNENKNRLNTSIKSIRNNHYVKIKTMVIIGFLVIFPLVIGITSIVGIPDTEYEYAIYEPGTSSYSELTFYPSMEELTASLDEDIPFNAKLIIRANESFLLDSTNGISGSKVRSRLKPQDFRYFERYLMKDHYDYQSFGVFDDAGKYWHYTEIDFSELDLLPGRYRLENSYYATSGFFWKGWAPQGWFFSLGRDELRVIPKGYLPQEEYSYNVVYTFDNGSFWTVVFEGQILNSQNESVAINNLELAIESVNNQYETIATIPTLPNGSFKYTHVVYSPSLNTNAMARIQWKCGSRYYRPLVHQEYCGLEQPIEGSRFFIDYNNDGFPEFPYDLYNLIQDINALPPPPDSLMWLRFSEGQGTKTYDEINQIEGDLKGDTSWTVGRYGTGLMFNTDGGSNDMVEFPWSTLSDLFGRWNNEWTVGGWIKPTVLHNETNWHGVSNTFLAKGSLLGNLELGITPQGQLMIYARARYGFLAPLIGDLATFGEEGSIKIDEWNWILTRWNNSDVSVQINDAWYDLSTEGEEPWDGAKSLALTPGPLTVGGLNFFNTYLEGAVDEFYFVKRAISNEEAEHLKGVLELTAVISKEDGSGGWEAIITPNETVEGYLNFECSVSAPDYKEIEQLNFYLAESVHNITNPDVSEWNNIKTFYGHEEQYSHVMDSKDLPDNSYYFVVRALDTDGNFTYDVYDISSEYIPFKISYFNTSVNFHYLHVNNRINYNSKIALIANEEFEQYISSVRLFLINTYVKKLSGLRLLKNKSIKSLGLAMMHTEIKSIMFSIENNIMRLGLLYFSLSWVIHC